MWRRGAWEPGLPRDCGQALGCPLARRPCPDRSRWHGELSQQPAAVGSPCFSVGQGDWSLWSQLHRGHVVLRVPDCSISSKSRCSDGAATHRASQAPHLPAEAGRLRLCWLPTSCQPCRPLCRTPVSALNSPSPFPALAPVLRAVSGGLPELEEAPARWQSPLLAGGRRAGREPRGLQAPAELQVPPLRA